MTHLSKRKIPTIFAVLRAMHNYYLQRDFQIVFVKGDGEFKPIEYRMSDLFGSWILSLVNAYEHVP